MGIDYPDLYILVVAGDCFLPDISDGDQLVLSPAEKPGRGDLVAIWHQDKNIQPMVKRLTLAVPEIRFHPDSEVMPVIICEQTNPQREFAIPMDKVSAVHKVVAQISTSAAAGWQDDGLYAYDWGKGDRSIDWIKVRTKKGALRKEPLGTIRYNQECGENVRKVDLRSFE